MKIHSESQIHHPLEQVYRSYRDHLSQIAPYTLLLFVLVFRPHGLFSQVRIKKV